MDWKLEVVVVPVADVDRAKRFYAEQVKFNVDLDMTFGTGARVVQLTPSGSACSIQIGSGLGDAAAAPGSAKGLQLVVADVASARAELAERGVEISQIQHYDDGVLGDGPGGPWNSFVFFDDPDGNGWAIQEKPSEG